MIGFIIVIFGGAFLGVVVMSCCFVASKADNEIEQMENESNNEKKDS